MQALPSIQQDAVQKNTAEHLHHDFDGQQEGERVLWIIRLHPVKRVVNFVYGLMIALVFFAGMMFVPEFAAVNRQYFYVFLSIISLLIITARMWWGELHMKHTKTFITDRRIIRFEFAVPPFRRKRSLFWSEIAKVKTISLGVLFSMAKIGALSVQPLMIPGEEIYIPYVYYFGDLANYMDKILYLQKNKPEEISQMREFVAKPKGQRY